MINIMKKEYLFSLKYKLNKLFLLIKLILIILIIYYLKYFLNNINLKSSNLIFKNVTIRTSFNDKIFTINNIELNQFSGQYQDIEKIETINNNNKYLIEDIYFLLTTNTKRIRHTINFIKFWAKTLNIKCLIVFEENDLRNNKYIKEYLLNEQIKCDIEISKIKRYEERYVQLIEQGWNKQNKTKWFAIGDDDTIWFIDNLLKTLQQYNSSNLFYLGNISYRNETIQIHGKYYAYAGGGILLTLPLISLFIKYNKQCQIFNNMYGGDEIIGKCITHLLNINLTINQNFHQIDQEGDIRGYLQSGIDGLVSLHHMFSFWEPFPEEHTFNDKETIFIIELSYYTFKSNFLKRYFKINNNTNQTLLLTYGYSFTLFNRILSYEELNRIEITWCCHQIFQKNTRPLENNTIHWFFKRLTISNLNGHFINSSIYENNQKRTNSHIPNLEIFFLN